MRDTDYSANNFEVYSRAYAIVQHIRRQNKLLSTWYCSDSTHQAAHFRPKSNMVILENIGVRGSLNVAAQEIHLERLQRRVWRKGHVSRVR
jgi:hypothetical protein